MVAALVGAREAFGQVSGGALSPAPESAASWWRTYTEHWHPLLTGTDVPAPPYLLPMAVRRHAARRARARCLVSLILVLAVPVALWGAWRFLRVAGPPAQRRGCLAVAAGVGLGDLCPGAGHERRLG